MTPPPPWAARADNRPEDCRRRGSLFHFILRAGAQPGDPHFSQRAADGNPVSPGPQTGRRLRRAPGTASRARRGGAEGRRLTAAEARAGRGRPRRETGGRHVSAESRFPPPPPPRAGTGWGCGRPRCPLPASLRPDVTAPPSPRRRLHQRARQRRPFLGNGAVSRSPSASRLGARLSGVKVTSMGPALGFRRWAGPRAAERGAEGRGDIPRAPARPPPGAHSLLPLSFPPSLPPSLTRSLTHSLTPRHRHRGGVREPAR